MNTLDVPNKVEDKWRVQAVVRNTHTLDLSYRGMTEINLGPSSDIVHLERVQLNNNGLNAIDQYH